MDWLYKLIKNIQNSNDNSVKRYCEVEYGSKWERAYNYYKANKSFPRYK